MALKDGVYDNEISRFRYDVTLKVAGNGKKQQAASPDRWLTWDEAGEWRDSLDRMLAGDSHSAIGVRGIRDARVSQAVSAVELLRSADSAVSTAEEIRAACAGESGEDPNAIMNLAKSFGAGLCWRKLSSQGIYDVIFRPREEPLQSGEDLPWARYPMNANSPPLQAGDAKLTGELQDHLRRSLPDYMVPSAVMVLSA